MKKINQGKNTNEPKLIFRVESKSETLAQNKPVYPEDRQQFRFTENFDGRKLKSNVIVYPISTSSGQMRCTSPNNGK